MRLNQKPRMAARQKGRMLLRLKAVQCLSMSEPDAARLIFRIESDPLFLKIRPFIRRRPERGGFRPLFDEKSGSIPAVHDIDWSGCAREISLIRKMGEEKFERYFLYGDIAFTPEEMAASTGLSAAEAADIKSFVFAASIREHRMPSGVDAAAGQAMSYSCLGRIELRGDEPELSWSLPHLARGRYEIDRPGLAGFQKNGLTPAELGKLPELLRAMELANLRHVSITRLVRLIARTQARFLSTGDSSDLVPFPPSEAARQLRVCPSTVSRCSAGRSLITPQNSELPLRFFMPNRRTVLVRAIGMLLSENPEATDACLARLLMARYRLRAARRTVNECRRPARP